MEKRILERVKKTLIVLLLVSVVVSLTAASVSAWECPTKEKAPPEQGACAKSMAEQAPSEKGACAKSVEAPASQSHSRKLNLLYAVECTFRTNSGPHRCSGSGPDYRTAIDAAREECRSRYGPISAEGPCSPI